MPERCFPLRLSVALLSIRRSRADLKKRHRLWEPSFCACTSFISMLSFSKCEQNALAHDLTQSHAMPMVSFSSWSSRCPCRSTPCGSTPRRSCSPGSPPGSPSGTADTSSRPSCNHIEVDFQWHPNLSVLPGKVFAINFIFNTQ